MEKLTAKGSRRVIAITPAAQGKLIDILETQLAIDDHIRVSVARGPHGCVHGWRLAIEHDPQPDDVVYAIGSLQVVVEPELTEALEAATIDYREDGAGIGFRIDVPDSKWPSRAPRLPPQLAQPDMPDC